MAGATGTSGSHVMFVGSCTKRVASRVGSCGSCRRSVCGPETGRGCFDIHVKDVQGMSASEIIPETGAEASQATRRAREAM